jgi:hypothetical protein
VDSGQPASGAEIATADNATRPPSRWSTSVLIEIVINAPNLDYRGLSPASFRLPANERLTVLPPDRGVRMSVYYFNIEDGYPMIPCLGAELPSINAARAQALRYAGGILGDQQPSFWKDGPWKMTVSDEHNHFLFAIVVGTHDAPVAPI